MYSTSYATPPPGYNVHQTYEYVRKPPQPTTSPSPGSYGYYSPRYASVHTPSPRGSPKMHSRHASHDPPMYTYSPHPSDYYGAYSPHYYASQQSTPRRKSDYVSQSYATRSKSRRFEASAAKPSRQRQRDGDERKHRSSKTRYTYYTVFQDADGEYVNDAPPPYQAYDSYADADHYGYYDQVPVYEPEAQAQAPRRSRARRASQPSRPSPQPQYTSSPKRPSTAKAAPRQATEADMRKHQIPAGYSTKNWDPNEEPIILLGSVFDANSLGRWIYDWTVFYYGAGEPMTDVAGDLWLLLIQLSGKIKRVEECMPKIRRRENREMVDEFLESGERLWGRFEKLLKICEEPMMKAARRECGDKKPVTMGKNSGKEFVKSIFGRDRELQKTEKLMASLRLWSHRYDVNCEDILRFPSQ